MARREDHPSPTCEVEAFAVLQVLVYPDGFEAFQGLSHLRPLFDHLWRRLEEVHRGASRAIRRHYLLLCSASRS